MRCAVCGVPSFWSRGDVMANATALCRATHADPRCLASCVTVCVIVAELLRGAPAATAAEREAIVADAIASAASAVGNVGPNEEAIAKAAPADEAEAQVAPAAEVAEADADATRARKAAAELRTVAGGAAGASGAAGFAGAQPDAAPTPQTLRDLALDEPRAIGYTYKCLGAGLWAFRADDNATFERTIQRLVAEGGDADTNAAVAGALLGCRLGFSKLPSEWVAQLPHRAWLEAHVQKVLFMLRLR